MSDVPAQEVGARLEHLRQINGSITPAAVVDDARPVEAVMHPLFEWDDAVAGERWRIVQAGEVIRSVRVIADTDAAEPVSTRAFISVTDEDTEGSKYEPLSVVLNDSVLYVQVLRRAAEDLQSLQDRYSQFVSLKRILTHSREEVLIELESTKVR